MIPSQQEKTHAHSFVLGPELRIQYTHTCVNNSEHHRFELDTHTLRFSQEFILQLLRIHVGKLFLANEFDFNASTYTTRNPWEFDMYLLPLGWYTQPPPPFAIEKPSCGHLSESLVPAPACLSHPKGPNLDKDKLQSHLKFSVSLESFNLDLQNSPQKKRFGGWLACNLA